MRYGLGIKILISFLVGGVAVLYKFRLRPDGNQSEYSTVVKVPRNFLFSVLTQTKNVPAYFSWVSSINEMDPKKNLTIGKRYRGIVDLPFLGQHQVIYKVTDFNDGHWLVLKPDDLRGTYLNTELVLMINAISKTETQLYMKITYRRTSALFQWTIGPFLKWLTDQQLRRAAFSARALGTSKWAQWQNTSTTKPKLSTSKAPHKYRTHGKGSDESVGDGLMPKLIRE